MKSVTDKKIFTDNQIIAAIIDRFGSVENFAKTLNGDVISM